MNFKIIPARAVCIRCSHSQPLNGDHCTGCGASFIFGKQDAWKPQIYKARPKDETGLEFLKSMMETTESKLFNMRCMWEDVKPGTPMGMVCPCPRCSPYFTASASLQSQTVQDQTGK